MLLPSGGGGGDAAAAAVVPRPCIWSGMMIRTGALLAGWAGLRLEVAAGKTAGQAAVRQARDIARWR
jgi:hypothetical protein